MKHKTIDISADITSVSDGAVMYYGVTINTVLSAHVCLIQEGTTVAFRIPASAPAGNYYDHGGEEGVEITNLIVNPDDSATGEIVVHYRDGVR